MRIKNIVEKTKNVKVNQHYDAGIPEIMEIVKAYKNPVDSSCAAFKYGYMQGIKAEKAEEKKRI